MKSFDFHPVILRLSAVMTMAVLASSTPTLAQRAYVRVSQVGYEEDSDSARAYLMSTTPEPDATFSVLDEDGAAVFSNKVGTLMGTWGNSTVTYQIYPLDFHVPRAKSYTIRVSGPVPATSPRFAVALPGVLYNSLMVNSRFFYETERDGRDYIPNALRTEPGHVKDQNAKRFVAPPIDQNGYINNLPPTPPLVSAGLPNINASGGWWDAGDYEKYVTTTSYTVAMMETGVRDFPNQMGANAPFRPPAAPNTVSYAGASGNGAPDSGDFTAEAEFGVDWLLKMWDQRKKILSLQVDTSQEWNYYGFGYPASIAGKCGGTYVSKDCFFTDYDIWILPQAADDYEQAGDGQPCDIFTSYFICNRPVYVAGPSQSHISPNLAGRLAADFALCYQLKHLSNPGLASRCLRSAEEIYALADTSLPDPGFLLSSVPDSQETVWDDDMEWGAAELSLALASAGEDGRDLPDGLPVTDPNIYLRQATSFAKNYIEKIYAPGYADTLNFYDVSSLAHFELYRAIKRVHHPSALMLSGASVRQQLLDQVDAAVNNAATTAFDFGDNWDNGDITSHGAGLSVMASEAYALTHQERYKTYAQRWLANILGANAWGASFIVGAGSTFPNCIQHQVANLAGALNGTSGGTPILWGAVTEGPNTSLSSGLVPGMRTCPVDGVDTFTLFNGNSGAYDPNDYVSFVDDVQSYTTTEPAIDLSATSFLMWSWRLQQTLD